MKVLIGAALVWVLARHSLQTYLAFAKTPNTAQATASSKPAS